jgi:hypothetical protein
VSRLLVAQRALTVPGWAKDALWRRAQAIPSLDLRFADNKSLVDATTGSNLVTFTRASSGTYTDSAGVLQTARTNLLLQSEDFSTTWTNVRSTDSTNTAIAPNGTLTADELIEDNASGLHFIFQQTTKASASNSYVFSVYVKRATSGTRNVMLALTDGTTGGLGAIFDPDDGSVALASANIGSTSGWSMATASPGVSAGNGWWRFSVAITSNTSTRMDAVIYMTDGTTISYLGDNNSNLYLWGAQLEQSATVGEYIPTTSTINRPHASTTTPQRVKAWACWWRSRGLTATPTRSLASLAAQIWCIAMVQSHQIPRSYLCSDRKIR